MRSFFLFLAHQAMRLLKILCLFFLLGSDFQLKPASLEAQIPPAPKCDGRWNILFAPQSPWILQKPTFLGGAAALAIIFCWILAAVGQHIHVRKWIFTAISYTHWTFRYIILNIATCVAYN